MRRTLMLFQSNGIRNCDSDPDSKGTEGAEEKIYRGWKYREGWVSSKGEKHKSQHSEFLFSVDNQDDWKDEVIIKSVNTWH